MALQLLEIYLDSYNSKPFIYEKYVPETTLTLSHGAAATTADEQACAAPLWFSASDESVLENWICQLVGRQIDIHTDLRVADIRLHQQASVHGLPSTTDIQSTCVRVRLVD